MTQPFDMVYPTHQRLMASKQTTLPLWIRVGENTARDRSVFDCAPFTCLSPSLPAAGVLSRWSSPHPCWFVYFVLTCTCTCSILIRIISITIPVHPGWSNLATVRNLYRAYDLSAVVRAGHSTVIGARLGMCKYGYHNMFCTPHASGSGAGK